MALRIPVRINLDSRYRLSRALEGAQPIEKEFEKIPVQDEQSIVSVVRSDYQSASDNHLTIPAITITISVEFAS